VGVDVLLLCLSGFMAGFSLLIRRRPQEPEQRDEWYQNIRERARPLMWTGVGGVVFFGLRLVL
jgi:hypothetical protein